MGFLNEDFINTGKIESIETINKDRLEPTGFSFPQTLTQNLSAYVDINFDNSNRTFSISPKSPYTSYSIYINGVKHVKENIETVVISNISGNHYLYFDTDGILKETMTEQLFFINGHVPISYIYWNADEQIWVRLGLETHGSVMSWGDPLYNHETSGTNYVNGLLAGNYTLLGNGSLNSDAQISISNGQIDDEDIRFYINHSDSPSDFGEQILSPIANIYVVYKKGVNGNWTYDFGTPYPVKQGISRIQYNKNTAGTWSTEDASGNDKFIAMWIVASNCKHPISAILGQREDSTLNDAKANNIYGNLDLSSLPFIEIKPLWRLIFQTNSMYTNVPKCKLVDVESLLNIQSLQISAISTSDHNTLSNRTALDSHPASAISYDNSISGLVSTDSQEAIDELESKKIDKNASIVSATKTKITYDSKGLVTSGVDATTSDISDSLDKRYVTDLEKLDITHSNRTNLDSINQNLSTTSNPTFSQLTVGNVSNTELQYLDGVTSAIQTQLNSKSPIIYYGGMYEDANGRSTIVLSSAGTYYQWTGGVTGLSNGITFDNINKRLVVNSGSDGVYNIIANLSFLYSRINTTSIYEIFKNGVATGLKGYFRTSNTSNMAGISINRRLSLVAGDYIDLRTTSAANNDTVTIYYISLNMSRIG